MNRKHTPTYIRLGKNIAHYRKENQLSQEALAERVNISRTHMGNIEAPGAAKSVSLDVLFDIAQALGVDPYQLLAP